ncbi:RING-CH-type domain-containing protein [Aphelenchoides bicaudatus]|nr:RING-CH-type domain-containing protein [Aphelenchoides bicaudatus]
MEEDTSFDFPSSSDSKDTQALDSLTFDDEFNTDEEICRVCRVAGDEQKLYHPCLCAGSIKFVHQECLLQWLKYSKKEVCELCNHKFDFKPVYSPNMPQHLPIGDIVKGSICFCTYSTSVSLGVFFLVARFLKTLLTYLFVAFCWIGLVPLIASRTHQIVFNGLINSIFSTRIFSLFSVENIAVDITKGWFIMTLFVCTFIALVWLREQVNVGVVQDMNLIPHAPMPNPEPAPRPPHHNLQQELRAFLLDDELAEEPNADANQNQEEEAQPADPANNNQARDVDQIVENMTWQRLLGLDGSFAFIENVFWVVSLNFGFHVIFLLCPSLLGAGLLEWLNVSENVVYFKTAINIFVGYIAIVMVVYAFHCLFKAMHYHSLSTVTQFTYLIIKVLLLIITELILFPILCGFWLDLCSLSLTGSTLQNRMKTFHSYPVSSTVLHWLTGMLYVFYSASFILTLRSLLRPGVLWFIRNLNDPEFSPINEMLTHTIYKHCRRLVASTTLFLSIIFLVVYCPLRIIKACSSGIIPYMLSATEGQFGGFSLELMLLQIVLPSTLEYMKAYNILDYLVKQWCKVVGKWLDLESYLLSHSDRERMARNEQAEHNERPAGQENPLPQPNDLAGRHQALLMVREAQEVETYTRPDHFYLRLIALLVCVAVTSILLSLMLLLHSDAYCSSVSHSIHDIYSVAIGFYACWLLGKLFLVCSDLFKRGRDYINATMRKTGHLVLKVSLAVIPILGVIPFLLSMYFQLLIIGPLRVSISQTPVLSPSKEWAMGILHLKIICATIMMGPEWRLKTALEQIYADGVRNIRLKNLYVNIVLPVVNTLTLLIVAPYVVVRAVLMCLDVTPEEHATFVRFSFPSLLVGILALLYLRWAYKRLCSLHRRLRDEKYLIGSQLVNFYREGTVNPSTS